MSEYTIKKLDSNQFDILIPLMKNCFGMDVNTDYFKWKYLKNPAGNFVGFVAVETKTGEVAAFYGMIPERYIIEGEKKTIYQACDAMTHSDHRRRGLFEKLVVSCREHLKNANQLFVIVLAIGAHPMSGFIKFGWKRAFNFQHLFVPRMLCHASILSKSADACETISDLQILEPLIETKSPAQIYSFRDMEHLEWRYRNPLHSYTVKTFGKKLDVEGFVCYYIENKKIFLFDFVFKTENSRKSLLANLKKQVVKDNLKGVTAFCQEKSSAATELKRGGFLVNPFKRGPLSATPPLMFYSDEETMNKFSSPDCWSIKSYDHDAL